MATNALRSVWPEWEIDGKPLGRGSYGVVYKAVRRDHNIESSAAIKVISIPSDPSEIDSLRSEGLDMDATRTYLQGIVNDFVSEIQLMESLKGVQNIVSVEDYKVVEKTGELGWDIYIRMELLTPLNSYLSDRTMSQNEVIKLGVDLCTALELCARKNVIHRDIKPENIFVNQFGDFKLGDFGVARKLENLTAGLSQKGTYNYMAPEVVRGENYDATADLYSLGLVLYRFTNNNRLPFLNDDRQLLNPNERIVATRCRLDGEPLPPPCQASPALAQVILCACSPDPRARFSSPTAMKNALIYARNSKPGAPAVPGNTMDQTVSVRRPAQTMDPDKTTAVRRARVQQVTQPETYPVPQESKKRSVWIPVLAALLAVAILGTVVGLLILPRLLDQDSKETEQTVEAEQPAPEESAEAQAQTMAEAEAPATAPDITGEWVDTVSERAYMDITEMPDGSASVEITATQPNNIQEKWLLNARWDAQAQKYTYVSGVKQSIQMEGLQPVPVMVYSDGSGSFSVVNGTLYWEDQKENAGARCTFASHEEVYDSQFQAIREQATQLPLSSARLDAAPNTAGEAMAPAAVSSAWATSTIQQQKCSNDPILLFDGDDTSSWQEGVSGPGIGESVTASLNRPYEIKYISFKLGNWRNDYYYGGNSKPKTMTITVGDYATQITFEDAKKVQWVGFSRPVTASSVSIRIDDIYYGTSWEDTAICEMTIYGK